VSSFICFWNHRRLNQYYTGGESLEDWKVKISVLWLIAEGTILAYIFLRSAEIGAVEQAGPDVFLLFAMVSLIPLIMAFLSLTLKDSINRWAHIIVGIVFVVIPLVVLSEAVAKSSAWAILNTLSGVVVAALIVWYAWKSKQKA